jgi:hypothetical protein
MTVVVFILDKLPLFDIIDTLLNKLFCIMEQFDNEGIVKTPMEQFEEALNIYGSVDNIPEDIRSSLEPHIGSLEEAAKEMDTRDNIMNNKEAA